MSKVWECADSSGGELLVLLAIADFCNDKGFAWPSVDTLSKKSRLSERQTQRAIRTLKKKGYLNIGMNDGPHGVNLYSIHLEEGGDKTTPVTPVAERGDMEGTKGVTPMSPKPSGTVKESPLHYNWGNVCPCLESSPRAKELWEKWMEHRIKLKKPTCEWFEFFDQQARWLKQYDSMEIIDILEKSVINGYQGLFKPAVRTKSSSKPSFQDQASQRNMDALIRQVERAGK